MKWVVFYDLDHAYNYYNGLVIEAKPNDTPDVIRKLRQVNREIEKASEQDYEDRNAGKTEKDKDDERKFKAELSSFKDTQAFYVFDTLDKYEYWRYLFHYDEIERTGSGLLCFIIDFYTDYQVKDLMDEII
jgi:hypothetical protein